MKEEERHNANTNEMKIEKSDEMKTIIKNKTQWH